MTDDKTPAPMTDARLSAIRAMKFTTGLNAACGVFDTDVERDLYRLAAENYNARLELLREVDRRRNVAGVIPAQPSEVVVSMTREDARELGLILDMDRQRMDKGDDRPVPQPRWGANVRVSKAVAAALYATREG